MKKIAVIGSVNMDLVFETGVIPRKGETILGHDFFMGIGGKGSNQAVAAARLGGDVTFFGSVGHDIFSEQIQIKLADEKIKTELNFSEKESGVAQVNIFDSDNSIIVVPGANWDFDRSFIEHIEREIIKFDVFIFQLEIPLEVVERLIRSIKFFPEKIIILNPAPAAKLDREIIDLVDYLTPNEHEIAIIDPCFTSIEDSLIRYPEKLLVTMGPKGVKYFDSNSSEIVTIEAMSNVNVLDTTGAGDTFSGAFGFSIAEGLGLEEAIKFANIAAGISVTKFGAQTGMPYYEEIMNHQR